ncbi:hypothetical protein MJH12_02755, partial [bacterium]|nr:hypothetical protein [bacterium]
MRFYKRAVRSSILAITAMSVFAPNVKANQEKFSKVASIVYRVESCLDQFNHEIKECGAGKYLMESSKGVDDKLARVFYDIESSGKIKESRRQKLLATLTPMSEVYQEGLSAYRKANKSKIKPLLALLSEAILSMENGADKADLTTFIEDLRAIDSILADSINYSLARDGLDYVFKSKIQNLYRLRALLYDLAGKRKSPKNIKMFDSKKHFSKTFSSVASLLIHAESCLDLFSQEVKECQSGYSMYNIAYQAAPSEKKEFYDKYSDRKLSERHRNWLHQKVINLQENYEKLLPQYRKSNAKAIKKILPLVDKAVLDFDQASSGFVFVQDLLKSLHAIDPILANNFKVLTYKGSQGKIKLSDSKKSYLYRLQWILHKSAKSRKRLKRGIVFSSKSYFDQSFSSLASLIYHAEACLDQFNQEQSDCNSGYSLYNMAYSAAPNKVSGFYDAYNDRKISQRKRNWLSDQVQDLKAQYQESLPAYQKEFGAQLQQLIPSIDELISLLEDPSNDRVRIEEFANKLKEIDPQLADSLLGITYKTGDDRSLHISKSKLSYLYRLKGIFNDASNTEAFDAKSQTFSSEEYFHQSFGALASMVYLIEACLDEFHQEKSDCRSGYSLYNHTFKVDPSMTSEFYDAYNDSKISQRKRLWLHQKLEQLEVDYEASVRSFRDLNGDHLKPLDEILKSKIAEIQETGEAVDLSEVKSLLSNVDFHLVDSMKSWTYERSGQVLLSSSKLNYLHRLRALLLDITGSRKKILRGKVFSSHTYFEENFSSLITMLSYAKSCISKMQEGENYCRRGYSLYNRSFQSDSENRKLYYDKFNDRKFSVRHKDWLEKRAQFLEDSFDQGVKEYSIKAAKNLKGLVAELSGLVLELEEQSTDFTDFIQKLEEVDIELADGVTSVSYKTGLKIMLSQSSFAFMTEFQNYLQQVVEQYSEDDVSMILTSKQVLFMV